MNKRTITKFVVVIPFLLLLAFSIILIQNSLIKDNVVQNDQRSINVNFSEEYLDENQLIDKSDCIYVGKISSIKEKSRKIVTTYSSENKEVKIEVPYVIYNVEIEDALKNASDKKKIQLVTMDSKNYELEIGQSYLFYTTRNDNGTFVPISYSRGLLKVGTDKAEIINEKTKEKYSYEKLKENILNRVNN